MTVWIELVEQHEDMVVLVEQAVLLIELAPLV